MSASRHRTGEWCDYVIGVPTPSGLLVAPVLATDREAATVCARFAFALIGVRLGSVEYTTDDHPEVDE